MDMMQDFFNGCKDFFNGIEDFCNGMGAIVQDPILIVGHGCCFVGSVGEQLALLGVIVGFFLIRFGKTDIVRKSIVMYFISLIIEVIGLAILK